MAVGIAQPLGELTLRAGIDGFDKPGAALWLATLLSSRWSTSSGCCDNSLEKLKIEVRRLSAEIEYQHVRRFVEMPDGWGSLNLLSMRKVVGRSRHVRTAQLRPPGAHQVRTAGGVLMRFYPALMILVTVTVAGWSLGMYVHAFLLPK